MAAETLGQIRSDVNNFPLAPLPDEPEVLIDHAVQHRAVP
jgi:hypothetical protein